MQNVLRGENVRDFADRGLHFPAGTSKPRIGPDGCLPPYTPRPFHRHQASQESYSARWSRQSSAQILRRQDKRVNECRAFAIAHGEACRTIRITLTTPESTCQLASRRLHGSYPKRRSKMG